MQQNNIFVTGGIDKTIRIWHLDSKNKNIKRNVYSKDLLRLAYVGDNQNWWYFKTGKYNTDGAISCLTAANNCIMSGDYSGNLRIHTLDTLIEVANIEAHEKEINAIQFTQKFIVSGGKDRFIHIFDAVSHKRLYTVDDHSSVILDIVLIEKENQEDQLISLSNDKNIQSRAIGKKENKPQRTVLKQKSNCLQIVGDELFVAGDKHITTYQIQRLKQIRNIEHERVDIICMSINSQQSLIATASNDKSIRLYELESNKLLGKFTTGSSLNSCQFTSDSQKIIGVTSDGCIFVWRLARDTQQIQTPSLNISQTPAWARSVPSQAIMVHMQQSKMMSQDKMKQISQQIQNEQIFDQPEIQQIAQKSTSFQQQQLIQTPINPIQSQYLQAQCSIENLAKQPNLQQNILQQQINPHDQIIQSQINNPDQIKQSQQVQQFVQDTENITKQLSTGQNIQPDQLFQQQNQQIQQFVQSNEKITKEINPVQNIQQEQQINKQQIKPQKPIEILSKQQYDLMQNSRFTLRISQAKFYNPTEEEIFSEDLSQSQKVKEENELNVQNNQEIEEKQPETELKNPQQYQSKATNLRQSSAMLRVSLSRQHMLALQQQAKMTESLSDEEMDSNEKLQLINEDKSQQPRSRSKEQIERDRENKSDKMKEIWDHIGDMQSNLKKIKLMDSQDFRNRKFNIQGYQQINLKNKREFKYPEQIQPKVIEIQQENQILKNQQEKQIEQKQELINTATIGINPNLNESLKKPPLPKQTPIQNNQDQHQRIIQSTELQLIQEQIDSPKQVSRLTAKQEQKENVVHLNSPHIQEEITQGDQTIMESIISLNSSVCSLKYIQQESQLQKGGQQSKTKYKVCFSTLAKSLQNIDQFFNTLNENDPFIQQSLQESQQEIGDISKFLNQIQQKLPLVNQNEVAYERLLSKFADKIEKESLLDKIVEKMVKDKGLVDKITDRINKNQ